MRKFFFFFAITGWVLGLIVHLTALLGDYDLSRQFPFLWILHIGVFLVWIPAVLQIRTRVKENKEHLKHFVFFKSLFKDTPTWFIIIGIAGLVYAFINFLLFTTSQPGSPDIKDGQYILHNHGQLIRTLTKQEYYHYMANQTRGFSGHWIAFYGLAAAILFPFNKNR